MARDNTESDTDGGRSRLNRRSMLMALGAGSSVALTSPYSAASVQEGDGSDDDGADGGGDGSDGRRCPPCIDPHSGYLQAGETKADGQPLGSIDPVTTVELRVTDANVVFPEAEDSAMQTNETATNETGADTTPTVTPTTETPTQTANVTMDTTPTVTETANETMAGENETGTETGTAGGEPQGMPDFYFDPVGIHLQPGDTVEFLVREQLHTVTAFHPRFGFQQRIPDGAPRFTSPPFLPEDSWYYQFDEPGVYDMFCLPHLGLGMVVRAVVVDEETEDVPEAYPEPDPEEARIPPIPLTVLGAPELDPQNIVEQGPVQWTDLTLEMETPPEPDEGDEAMPTVQVGDHAEHGDILVGPDGMTLYMFDNDTQGEQTSACQDDCADTWPPLTVEEEPVAGDGVTAALATFEREAGGTQVMANGWPLYSFARDEEPGDANGQGISDVWWVLGPDGTPIRPESTE